MQLGTHSRSVGPPDTAETGLSMRGLSALHNRSTRPRQVKRRHWPKPMVTEIRRLRDRHPNLGATKIYPLLQGFCDQQGCRYPSVSTIKRIIASAPDKMRLVPVRLSPKGKPKALRRTRGTQSVSRRGLQPAIAATALLWIQLSDFMPA